MEEERKKNGLVTFYNDTTKTFLEKWPAIPNKKEMAEAQDEEEAKAAAAARIKRVSR